MDEQLVSLLDYEGVLSALATTPDGLVVGAAGLAGDDAEIVGAAGTTLLNTVEHAEEVSGSLDVGSAAVHLLRGNDVSLVLLTEAGVPHEELVPVMVVVLDLVVEAFQ
jgi:predicted regulator of Ras-like GTPase activity (Roadblock/LC7/MglB family)